MPTATTVEQKPEQSSLANNPDDLNPQSTAPQSHSYGSRSIWKRFAKVTAVLLAGDLVLLLAIVYLSFLWNGTVKTHLWKRVILADWAATSVAITAVFVRAVVTIHTGVNVSVVSLAVLRRGALLPDVPRLSSMRHSPTSALWLSKTLISGVSQHIDPLLLGLSLLLTALTTLLQFSSTLLISDLSTWPLESDAVETSFRILANDSYDQNRLYENFYTDALASYAPSYPVFAEARRDQAKLTDPSFDDTGPTLRALLPISTENNRSSLQYFEGNTSLYDARWICAQPNITDLSLTGTWHDSMSLIGVWKPSSLVPPMVAAATDPLQYHRFNITWLPNKETSYRYGGSMMSDLISWPIFIHREPRIGLMSGLEAVYNSSKVFYPATDPNISGGAYVPITGNDVPVGSRGYGSGYDSYQGDAYVLVNFTKLTGDALPSKDALQAALDLLNQEYPLPAVEPWNWTDLAVELQNVSYTNFSLFNFANHRMWTTVQSTDLGVYATVYRSKGANLGQSSGSNGSETDIFHERSVGFGWNFSLDVTVCYSGFAKTKSMRVKARRNRTRDEPSDLLAGIKQLGAHNPILNTDERYIMTLDDATLYSGLSEERTQILRQNASQPINPTGFALRFNDLIASDSYWISPRSWWPAAATNVHEGQVKQFQRIIQSTGSPALAMQAMQHTVITDRYYKYLPYFLANSTQKLTFSQEAVQPRRKTGYMVVMAAIVLHIILTTVIFLAIHERSKWRSTILSLDQVWQSYTQVLTLRSEVDEVLDGPAATSLRDDDVKIYLRQRGIINDVVVLEDDGDGVVRFRKRHA